MTLAKLDVGAGAKRDEGYLTLDVVPFFKPDILGTLVELPFGDDHFDEVRCHHVLEHMERRDLVPVMNEMHRVLKPGGVVDIEIPVYPHLEAVADPTHLSFYHSATFDYFVRCDKKHEHGHPDAGCFEHQRLLYGIKPWVFVRINRLKSGALVRIAMAKLVDGLHICPHVRVSVDTHECQECGERLKR